MPQTEGTAEPGDETRIGIDIFGATDAGRVRATNQDQFFVASLRKSMQVRQTSLGDLHAFARLRGSSAHLLVVADGVGSGGGGELASGTAVEALAEHIGETIGCYYNFDVEREHDFLSQLQDAIFRAHWEVRARHASEGRSPATTLTMVALVWPRAYVVHVGDSRAYYLREGRLLQLTRDQTAFEALVDEGVLKEDATSGGKPHLLKNLLTSAIGDQIEPSIGLVDLQAGDVLILCTDGLTRHVPDDEIAGALVQGGTAEETCRRLIDLALARGGRDNITVIVGRFAAS